jgi:hypothetical protein
LGDEIGGKGGNSGHRCLHRHAPIFQKMTLCGFGRRPADFPESRFSATDGAASRLARIIAQSALDNVLGSFYMIDSGWRQAPPSPPSVAR